MLAASGGPGATRDAVLEVSLFIDPDPAQVEALRHEWHPSPPPVPSRS